MANEHNEHLSDLISKSYALEVINSELKLIPSWGGMGHLLISMWLNVHYNKHTFILLECSNFSIFDQKIGFNLFWKGKNYESLSGISNSLLTNS